MATDPIRQRDSETAGVVARPPLVFLGALLLGFAAESVLPWPFPGSDSDPGSGIARTVGGAVFLIGVAVFAASIRDFVKAKTPVQGRKPTRALVTTGMHGWSRNPIYLGMFLIYGGIGIAAGSLWLLLLIVPLAIVIRTAVVAREEAYLERRFGDAYRDYRRRVRRWL